MFPILPILGGLQSILKIGGGLFQSGKANQIDPQYSPYQKSQEVKNQYGLAQNLYNSRMPGAQAAEQNILNNQSNAFNNASRAATDSGQLLSLGSLLQGNSNNAIEDLATREAQDKYQRYGLLESAKDDMVREGDKVYADAMQKYQLDMQQKSDLRNSSWQNIFGGIGDLAGSLDAMNFKKKSNPYLQNNVFTR